MKLSELMGQQPMRDLSNPQKIESGHKSSVLERDMKPDVLKVSGDGILVKDRTATDDSVLTLFLNDTERRHLLSQLSIIGQKKGTVLTLDKEDRICDSSGKPIDRVLAKRVIKELKF